MTIMQILTAAIAVMVAAAAIGVAVMLADTARERRRAMRLQRAMAVQPIRRRRAR